MSHPKRIQRQRTKGWRMPDGAVYVGRPTKWGNPFSSSWYLRFHFDVAFVARSVSTGRQRRLESDTD